ncbi:RibD family protein [Oceanicaulis sp. MMSF_3324]|uniref:RibD family protein n=1 Tax=Oceanicaulis sp. MMSF_3324 TaxID=3046702 RepID=UPI00273F5630|nr:RibD family protein [Oceanicaulis sp. MMSF_3324]
MTASAPMRVTLKLATSLDGRIALANGQSQWITGPEARAEVHRMRAAHDALLTGIGTVLADDPQMTARPEGSPAARQPQRIVLDSQLRLPVFSEILTGDAVWVFHTGGARSDLENVELFETEADDEGRVSFSSVMQTLASKGIESVMIEAGAEIAGAAIRSGCVTRIEWFRAPKLIGAEGRACIAGLGLEELGLAPTFNRISVRTCGADLWETYQKG